MICGWIMFIILVCAWGAGAYGFFSLPVLVTALLSSLAVIFFTSCLLLVIFWLRVFSLSIVLVGYIIVLIVQAAGDVQIHPYVYVALVLYLILEPAAIYCTYLLCSYAKGSTGYETIRPSSRAA